MANDHMRSEELGWVKGTIVADPEDFEEDDDGENVNKTWIWR